MAATVKKPDPPRVGLVERAISAAFPGWGLRRAVARFRLQAVRQYQAAKDSRNRKKDKSTGSGDVVAGQDRISIRDNARNLEENYDLAAGVIDTLVDNVIASGIRSFPQVRRRDGELFTELNTILNELHESWIADPDVTGQYHLYRAQRLTARSAYRDGECFQQLVTGRAPGIVHSTPVPFAIELIETDYVPMLNGKAGDGLEVRYGIKRNAWGRPMGYYVHKTHPGEYLIGSPIMHMMGGDLSNLKEIPAADMLHLSMAKRIRQSRGVSVLSAVMDRLTDLKDYEEAERIAAKIGASIALKITKEHDNPNPLGSTQDDKSPRELDWFPGIIFDNLTPGEDVESIKNERPSNQLKDYRSLSLRSISSGTSAGYSSIARDYNGTYSAQRQELVESRVHYAVLTEDFISRVTRPTYRRFVGACLIAGLLPEELLRDANLATLANAAYRGPAVAYIDPLKEVRSEIEAIQAGIRSKTSVVLTHGGNPEQVEKEISSERERDEAAGIVHTSNPKWKLAASSAETDDDDTDEADEADEETEAEESEATGG